MTTTRLEVLMDRDDLDLLQLESQIKDRLNRLAKYASGDIQRDLARVGFTRLLEDLAIPDLLPVKLPEILRGVTDNIAWPNHRRAVKCALLLFGETDQDVLTEEFIERLSIGELGFFDRLDQLYLVTMDVPSKGRDLRVEAARRWWYSGRDKLAEGLSEYIRRVINGQIESLSRDTEKATTDYPRRRRVSPKFEKENDGFVKSMTTVESLLGRNGRLVASSTWTRELVPKRDGIKSWYLYTQVDVDMDLSPGRGIREITGPHGYGRAGMEIWYLELEEETVAGVPITVSYTKTFTGRPVDDDDRSGYLSLRGGSDRSREKVRMALRFTESAELPKVVVAFSTPIGTLPTLRHGRYDLKKLVRRSLDYDLGFPVPRHSNGLYWWYEPDDNLPDELRSMLPS